MSQCLLQIIEVKLLYDHQLIVHHNTDYLRGELITASVFVANWIPTKELTFVRSQPMR